MLQCSTSLWSADLTNLGAEVSRVAPFSDRFHIDVADGHYCNSLLFFPDLVKALCPLTSVPFEVHLMTQNPLDWIEPFVEAGADSIVFCIDATPDPLSVIRAIRAHGKKVGISILLSETPEVLNPYWRDLDQVTIMGTEIGIKGAGMDPSVPYKITRARQLIVEHRAKVVIEADGGIRRETVPLIQAAGADMIVAGSLMFKGDPPELRRWLGEISGNM